MAEKCRWHINHEPSNSWTFCFCFIVKQNEWFICSWVHCVPCVCNLKKNFFKCTTKYLHESEMRLLWFKTSAFPVKISVLNHKFSIRAKIQYWIKNSIWKQKLREKTASVQIKNRENSRRKSDLIQNVIPMNRLCKWIPVASILLYKIR